MIEDANFLIPILAIFTIFFCQKMAISFKSFEHTLPYFEIHELRFVPIFFAGKYLRNHDFVPQVPNSA
jgi:hypothetical protein